MRGPKTAHASPGTGTVNAATPAAPNKHPVRLNHKFVTGTAPWANVVGQRAEGRPVSGLRSYPGGSKSFFVDYRIDGRQRRITIGPFPRWSVDAARERAKGCSATGRPRS